MPKKPALLFPTPPVGTTTTHTPSALAVLDNNFAFVPDASVDLVLTDPPFNIARDTNFHTYEGNTINSFRFDAAKGWDSHTPDAFKALLNNWAIEFARVLRPGGSFAIFCADTYLSHLGDALRDAGLSTRRTLTWRKPNAVPVNRSHLMMSACEYVVVGIKGSAATFNADVYFDNQEEATSREQVLVAQKVADVVEKETRASLASLTAGSDRPTDVATAIRTALERALPTALKRTTAMYQVDSKGNLYLRGCVPNEVAFNSKPVPRLHPTEKPVALLEYLITLLSNPQDLILDPFAGSGSTGEASAHLHRRAILIEQDPEFFAKLSARLSTNDPIPL